MLRWPMAAKAPRPMEAMERKTVICCHWGTTVGNASIATRTNSATAATLGAAEKKAVTGVGAPSYTSGVHMWNGTADTLNARPAKRKTRPKMRPMDGVFAAAATPAKVMVAVEPENRDAPESALFRRRTHAGKRDGAGEAVDQRRSVEQHARRQRAKHEILQARLGRAQVVAVDGGDHIERQRHELEAKVERDQVAGRDHGHHAGGGGQNQHRELEAADVLAPHEIDGHEQRRGSADERQELKEAAVAVDDEATAERLDALRRLQQHHERGADQDDHGEDVDGVDDLVATKDPEHQERERAAKQHELGDNGGECG